MEQARAIEGYLEGQLLLAMPAMTDARFERTVIYMFAHSAAGAMGLVVNRPLDSITFPDLMSQLGIPEGPMNERIIVHFGGPVETGRGFVLHSSDYCRDATMRLGHNLSLTATVDVLRAIASGTGPRQSLLALGYAGWGPGQLEAEIQENGWLNAPADDDLIFGADLDGKWPRAVASLGIDLNRFSGTAGHA